MGLSFVLDELQFYERYSGRVNELQLIGFSIHFFKFGFKEVAEVLKDLELADVAISEDCNIQVCVLAGKSADV